MLTLAITKKDLDDEMTKLAAALDIILKMESWSPGHRRKLYKIMDYDDQPIGKIPALSKTEMYYALVFANEVLELRRRLDE